MKSSGVVDVLNAYRRLLTDRSLRMHETDYLFELVPSLIERAESDGLEARTDRFVYGDTVWDTEERLELIGSSDTGRAASPDAGFDEAVGRARERLERDWREACRQARLGHAEVVRQAHLERIAELLADADAMVDQLHTPTPSMLKLKPGESVTHPTDEDYAYWSREEKEGRLPPEAWYAAMNGLRDDLLVWSGLGGDDLPGCAAVVDLHWREPAENKHRAIAAAQRELGVAAPEKRRRESPLLGWFGFGAGPFAA